MPVRYRASSTRLNRQAEPARLAHNQPERWYQYGIVAVEGVSKCDFAMSRDVACRVSMFTATYKTFNINSLSNQIVETQNFASLLPH